MPVSPSVRRATTFRFLDSMQATKALDQISTLLFSGIMKEAGSDTERAAIGELLSRWKRYAPTIMAEAYEKTFNQSEMLELLQFLQTPIGLKFRASQATLEKDLSPLITQWMTKNMKELGLNPNAQ